MIGGGRTVVGLFETVVVFPHHFVGEFANPGLWKLLGDTTTPPSDALSGVIPKVEVWILFGGVPNLGQFGDS